MSDTKLFSGRLSMQSLPGLTSGGGPDVPVLKRLLLPQGELAQFHDSDTSIHYIAALELTKGSARGNHFHKIKVEHFYVLRGEVELFAQDMLSGELAQLLMQPGGLVIIQPGVAHAFQVVQSGFALEFAPTRFDPSDIHRHQLT